MNTPPTCLCGCCLAIYRYTSSEIDDADERNQNGNRLCVCGGDVCDCPSCAAEAIRIYEAQS